MKRTLPLWLLLGCSDALPDTSQAAPPSAEPQVQAAQGSPAAPAVPVPSGPNALLEDEQNTISVFDLASASTVFVGQKHLVRDWASRVVEVPSGSGTGFVWDTAGHIVTNYHVINGGSSFVVTLNDGRSFDARLVGGEPRKDVAVLKIDAPGIDLVPIRLPPPNQVLRVGQKAVAIGNPFGLDQTLTVGVISALGRDVDGFGGVTIRGMVQTDASINPGNSGGPLLDSHGRLIGMNTMIYSKSGASAGIGFAVPTDAIRRVVPEIIEYGAPQRLGFGVSLLPDEIARRERISGLVIEAVVPGSPAERAGLRGLKPGKYGAVLGDVIVAVQGKTVRTFDDLYQVVDVHKPGDVLQVKVQREGQTLEVPVEIVVLASK
jgi:S1-C subfamily serine protease